MSKRKGTYPKLSKLQGLMREYGVTVKQFAEGIGRAVSTCSKANNGKGLYDSVDLLNIQKFLNKKEAERAKELGREPRYYSIEEIFYS
jgi:hypothetical protein